LRARIAGAAVLDRPGLLAELAATAPQVAFDAARALPLPVARLEAVPATLRVVARDSPGDALRWAAALDGETDPALAARALAVVAGGLAPIMK